MPFFIPLFVGVSAAASTTGVATAGLIGSGGAITGAGLISGAVMAGGIVGGIGAYQQGQAAEAQGKAEQKILDYNAKLKEQEAAAELARSQEEARQFKIRGSEFQAGQRVGYAKGGVLAAGSPALVLEETALNLEADRMKIIKEGYLAESFRKSEAEGLRYQGRAAVSRGKNIKTASMYSAAGSLLTGIGGAAYAGSQMGSVGGVSNTAKATYLRY